jgi:hypothetical protein
VTLGWNLSSPGDTILVQNVGDGQYNITGDVYTGPDRTLVSETGTVLYTQLSSSYTGPVTNFDDSVTIQNTIFEYRGASTYDGVFVFDGSVNMSGVELRTYGSGGSYNNMAVFNPHTGISTLDNVRFSDGEVAFRGVSPTDTALEMDNVEVTGGRLQVYDSELTMTNSHAVASVYVRHSNGTISDSLFEQRSLTLHSNDTTRGYALHNVEANTSTVSLRIDGGQSVIRDSSIIGSTAVDVEGGWSATELEIYNTTMVGNTAMNVGSSYSSDDVTMVVRESEFDGVYRGLQNRGINSGTLDVSGNWWGQDQDPMSNGEITMDLSDVVANTWCADSTCTTLSP